MTSSTDIQNVSSHQFDQLPAAATTTTMTTRNAGGDFPFVAAPTSGGSGGLSAEEIGYVLVAIGGAAPLILLITVAVVMRCRTLRQRRRYATATKRCDSIIAAWADDSATSSKESRRRQDHGAQEARNGYVQARQGTATPPRKPPMDGAGQPIALTELAVREFFDVERSASTARRYPSPEGGSSYVTAASSTPTSGGSSGGVVAASDSVRLIDDRKRVADRGGPSSARGAGSSTFTRSDYVDRSPDITPEPSDDSANCSTPSVAVVGGSGGARPEVKTVVAIVETHHRPAPLSSPTMSDYDNRVVDDDTASRTLTETTGSPAPPPTQRLRRSEACYDITALEDWSPRSGRRSLSSDSADPDSASVGDSLGLSSASTTVDARPRVAPETETDCVASDDRVRRTGNDRTSLSTEEEQVLRCLDDIVSGYEDVGDFQRADSFGDVERRVTHL